MFGYSDCNQLKKIKFLKFKHNYIIYYCKVCLGFLENILWCNESKKG